jgi:hypothetical protein
MGPLTSLRLSVDDVALESPNHIQRSLSLSLLCFLGDLPASQSLLVLRLDHMVLVQDFVHILARLSNLQDLTMRHCIRLASPHAVNMLVPKFFSDSPGLRQLTRLTSLTLESNRPRSCDVADIINSESDDEVDASEFMERSGDWGISLMLAEIAHLTALQSLSLPLLQLSAAELWNLVPLPKLQQLTLSGFRWQNTRAGCAVLCHCEALTQLTVSSGKHQWRHLGVKQIHEQARGAAE